MTKESPRTFLDKFLNFIAPRDREMEQVAVETFIEGGKDNIYSDRFGPVTRVDNFGTHIVIGLQEPDDETGSLTWVVDRDGDSIRTMPMENWLELKNLAASRKPL